MGGRKGRRGGFSCQKRRAGGGVRGLRNAFGGGGGISNCGCVRGRESNSFCGIINSMLMGV